MKRETFEEKKHRILTGMMLKEMILPIVQEAREMIRNIAPDTGLELKNYLYFFKKRYYQVQSGKLKKLSEAEAKTVLGKQPETKVYFICAGGAVCPMPGILSGKENMEAVQVKDDAAAAFISEKSGIPVKKEDL